MNKVQNVREQVTSINSALDREVKILISVGTAVLDFVTVLSIVFLSSIIYHKIAYDNFGNAKNTRELAYFVSGVFLFTNILHKRYKISHYLTRRGQVTDAFNAWNVSMIAFIAVGFLAKVIDNYSRAVVLIIYLSGMIIVPLVRWWAVKLISAASKTGHLAAQRVIVIGREADITSFMTTYQPWNIGLNVLDVVVLQRQQPGETNAAYDSKITADIEQALLTARASRPDSAFIALPWSERELIDRCIDALLTTPVAIHLAPEKIFDRFEKPRIVRFGDIASLELVPPPLSNLDIALKRFFDFVLACVALVILAPLFAAIALIIKLDSKGPVFFHQRRFGFNRQPFSIYKFRTMSTLDDGDTIQQAKANDPRITRVGAFLRRWNFDELPQLVNVISGRMSLVGPRPHAIAHDKDFEQRIDLYARRHNVKPGITGWAQIHGLRGETETDEKMAQRVTYDLWYIDNWSFWLDFVIMARTVLSHKSFQNAR